MSDSLRIQMTALEVKLNHLSNSIGEIKRYTDHEVAPHHSYSWQVIVISLVMGLAPLFWWLFKTLKPSRKESEKLKVYTKEFFGNFTWFFGWIWVIGFLCLSLYFMGKIHLPYGGFMLSHFDLILAIATLFAIAGAVWAVYARIDAEKAFHQSSETFKKSLEIHEKSDEALQNSKKTLDAFGANFDFSEILNDDKLIDILGKVSFNNYSVSLFLGFPIIGYLYRNKSVFPSEKIEKTFDDLIKNLKGLVIRLKVHCQAQFPMDYELNNINFLISPDNPISNLELSIGVFSNSESKRILEDYYKNPENINIDPSEKTRIQLKLEKFYRILSEIDELQNKCKQAKINIIYKQQAESNFRFMGTNENLRFASLMDYTQNCKEYEKQKSLVWIVHDLNKGNSDFDSSVFQTSDQNLYKVLQTVF